MSTLPITWQKKIPNLRTGQKNTEKTQTTTNMNPEVKKAMCNTMEFLAHELSECNKKMTKFHAALISSEQIFEATNKSVEKTHPNLAYHLRLIRSQVLPRKINVALKEIKNVHQELTDLRRSKRQLLLEIKNLKKAADGFLSSNPRTSIRKLAAENTVLKAELALYKQKSKIT